MDIRCRHCGEPWDHDSLHEEAEVRYDARYGIEHRYDHTANRERANERYAPIFAEVSAAFRERGCNALVCAFGATCGPNVAHPAIGELTDLLGDDTDGLASMLEDAEHMGLLRDAQDC